MLFDDDVQERTAEAALLREQNGWTPCSRCGCDPCDCLPHEGLSSSASADEPLDDDSSEDEDSEHRPPPVTTPRRTNTGLEVEDIDWRLLPD